MNKPTLAAALLLAAAANASAFTYDNINWPGYGYDLYPGALITANPDGSFSTTTTGQGPYGNAANTYIGIINNSTAPINYLNLSSALDIFAFNNAGIDLYGAPGNSSDGSGYGGPDAYFTAVNPALTAGAVNFLSTLQPGAYTYFSLAGAIQGPDGNNASPLLIASVPEPPIALLLLAGLSAIALAKAEAMGFHRLLATRKKS